MFAANLWLIKNVVSHIKEMVLILMEEIFQGNDSDFNEEILKILQSV